MTTLAAGGGGAAAVNSASVTSSVMIRMTAIIVSSAHAHTHDRLRRWPDPVPRARLLCARAAGASGMAAVGWAESQLRRRQPGARIFVAGERSEEGLVPRARRGPLGHRRGRRTTLHDVPAAWHAVGRTAQPGTRHRSP